MLAWRAWAQSGQKPKDIPANPEKAYADEWLGWRDWLGQKPQKRIRPTGPQRTQRFPPLESSSRVSWRMKTAS